MTTIPEKEVVFTLICEPEEETYVGNCSAIDPVQDRKQEAWIRKQLARGNQWAWCSVTLRAEWRGLQVKDSLGCCSYLDEENFKQPDGYYDDMRQTCLEQLNDMRQLICNP